MKRLLLLLTLATPLAAQDSDLREILRDALYTEEVTRDPAAAAAQYEDLLARFRDQRALAATALFRLAEVRRKQDRKQEAIAHYQRLLSEFPEAGPEAKLARENLAALGAKPPVPGETVNDEESLELARLSKLAETSPDLLRDPKLLCNAAGQNRLQVMRFLLDLGADPNAILKRSSTEPGFSRETPLLAASGKGHLNACKLLLEAGADPNLDLHRNRPLFEAAIQGHGLVVELLLKHGAEPYFFPNEGSLEYVVGSALAQALRCGHPDIAALLIRAGAEVNPPTSPYSQTALHVAAGQGDAGSVKLLLDAGADPTTTLKKTDHPHAPRKVLAIPDGATPLAMAVEARSNDCVRLLLAADETSPRGIALRCAVELNSRELVELLLDAGTDPNALNLEGEPALTAALETDHAEILQLLLERGADPNLPFGSLEFKTGPAYQNPFAETSEGAEQLVEIPNLALYESTRLRDGLQATKSLLAAGARPNPAAVDLMIKNVAHMDEDGSVVTKLLEFRPDHFNPEELPPMEHWQPAARQVFLEQIVYPALSAKPEIPFVFLNSGRLVALDQKTGASKPAPLPLAQLLLYRFDEVTKPDRNKHQWSAFKLVRKDPSGNWSEIPLELAGDDPFPDLQWGDIITAEPDPTKVGQPGHINRDTAKLLFNWAFRKRISFPITIEIDGKSREITLKGCLLVYDPTRNEAPWLDAVPLVALLAPSHEHRPDAVLNRGGEEIRLISANKILAEIPLQNGDHLVIQTRDESEKRGWRSVLTVPGFSVSRSFGSVFHSGIKDLPIASSHPTLIQAIVDTYAPWPRCNTTTLREFSDEFLANLAHRQSIRQIAIPAIPGHPDFGSIRIRRLEDDGSESIIELDLAAAIDRCTDDSPAAEARANDIPLRPGDIVELRVHQDRLGRRWTGFSPAEIRFFRKALGGRILLIQRNQQPNPFELCWQPPQWRDGPAGLLPLPPETGAATMVARELIGGDADMEIERDGKRSRERPSSQTFLRDGDQIHWTGTFRSPPRTRMVPTRKTPTSIPRVRRVPSPPKR